MPPFDLLSVFDDPAEASAVAARLGTSVAELRRAVEYHVAAESTIAKASILAETLRLVRAAQSVLPQLARELDSEWADKSPVPDVVMLLVDPDGEATVSEVRRRLRLLGNADSLPTGNGVSPAAAAAPDGKRRRAAPGSRAADVLEALRSGVQSPAAIATRLGVTAGCVQSALDILRGQGAARPVERGVWEAVATS